MRIPAHETRTVTFRLGFEELKIYTLEERYSIEPGRVEIYVGSNPNLPLRAQIDTE
ncbi:MAG: fibronectin type III-like domain-contianing protein [Lachnospiraceae bacterium]|nr:fibronectin type III-like domain-contianing protein [Lachnospiraceae bacterium]